MPLPPECGVEDMKTGLMPDYPFSTDGCSMSPDMDKGVKCCCAKHDFEYWQGGTAEQRKEADLKFKQCMKDSGQSLLSGSQGLRHTVSPNMLEVGIWLEVRERL